MQVPDIIRLIMTQVSCVRTYHDLAVCCKMTAGFARELYSVAVRKYSRFVVKEYETYVCFPNGVKNGVYRYKDIYTGRNVVCNYKNGLLDGKYTSYMPLPSMRTDCTYKDNRKHGECTLSQAGNVVARSHYMHGTLVRFDNYQAVTRIIYGP